MSDWLTDPELFLYAKGTGSNDVHLWRCKKSVSTSSSPIVPMKPDDFDYVSNVKNHMELLGDLFDWDETDYKRLVKYIFEMRLLVNSQGFVIAELHKTDKDGNKMTDDANKEIPAIYIRSLDVLALKHYIPRLMERPIPLRTVKYLGDINGKAALMEKDSNATELTARVDNLEAENIELKSKNNTLDSNIKTLEDQVTKLTADLGTQMNTLTTLQQEVKNIADNEAWMNGLTNSEWVGIEGLGTYAESYTKNLFILPQPCTFISDIDNGTNVRATYCYKIRTDRSNRVHKAIRLEDLTPNKEKARFSRDCWGYAKAKSPSKIFILGPEV